MGTETAVYKKYFLTSIKNEQNKEQLYNNDFWKVVIYNSLLDALRDLHTSECNRPRNRTYDGCLWKLAERNKVRTGKQLRFVASAETRLNSKN